MDNVEIEELSDSDLEGASGGAASLCCCSTTGGGCSNTTVPKVEAQA